MTRRIAVHVGWLVAVAIACARTSGAATDAFVVIVHPRNPITTIDRGLLRDAFLKKTLEWGSGEVIRPIDLAKDLPARERFTRDVLKKTPTQLKSYWSQQIFSGKAVPPPEATSPRAAIDYVLAHPGAVGYLPADTDPGGAKVVKVD